MDAVYDSSELEWAWGRVGDDDPSTDWSSSARVERQVAEDLSSVDGEILVFVRDPSGNVGQAISSTIVQIRQPLMIHAE